MDSSFPKIFVVILNFNGASTLQACISSVFKSDYPNLEIVVVDNNSKDESFEQTKNNFSRCHFIKNSENIGFSKGNNVGIRYALEKFADYIFVLNNDTVIEKDTLSLLLKTFSTNLSIGIVSPLILTAGNKDVWFSGGIVNWNKMKTSHLTYKVSSSEYKSDYLSGCAMLIKKDVFKKIGLFDERFFLYYEDADLSLRARKAGFDLIVNPKSPIQHSEQSKNNNAKIYWLVLSGLLFFEIHSTIVQKIWQFIHIAMRKIKNFYKLFLSKDTNAIEVRRAFIDFKKIPR
jgi:GT2 family glycosyltransferase